MLIRACSNLIHPRTIHYASKRRPGVNYAVVTPTLLNDAFCTCPGWQFRETCSHVDDMKDNYLCEWYGFPAEDYKDVIRCPNCGSLTEDFEMDAEWV